MGLYYFAEFQGDYYRDELVNYFERRPTAGRCSRRRVGVQRGVFTGRGCW